MVFPAFLAWAAINLGIRDAATFWDYILIPAMTRDKPGEPRGVRELAFRKMLQQVGMPIFGDISTFLQDNAYSDPVDVIADHTAIFGGAFGGRTIIGRFAIAGGVKTMAAGLSALGILLPAALRGDQQTLAANTAGLISESSVFLADMRRAAVPLAASVGALGAVVTNPGPESLGAFLTAGAVGIWGAAAAFSNWFERITGQSNPLPPDVQEGFKVRPDQQFKLETLDPALAGQLTKLRPLLPSGEPIGNGVDVGPRPLGETLERIELPRPLSFARGAIVRGDPATRAVIQAFDLAARIPKGLQEGLLRAFGF